MNLHFAPVYVGLNAIIALVLAVSVVRKRAAHKTLQGDGGHEDLARAIRAHANNAEYVPFALIVLVLAEMLSAPVMMIHGMGVVLTLARIWHGATLSKTMDAVAGRGVGTVATWLVILVGAIACIYYGLGI